DRARERERIRRDDADVALDVDERVRIERFRIDDGRVDVGEDLEFVGAANVIAVTRRAVADNALAVALAHLPRLERFDHAFMRHAADPLVALDAHGRCPCESSARRQRGAELYGRTKRIRSPGSTADYRLDFAPMRTNWMPAAPGDRLQDVDTPALILDLDRFEANLERMRETAASYNIRVRPHAKSHKCAEIARRQIAAGSVGICCQKLGEAEIFLARGIENVLITNEIVGERKLHRLAQLAWRSPDARLRVCVDDAGVTKRLRALCVPQ